MNPRPLPVFAVLVVVLVLAALDQTITSTALPSIARDLQSYANVSWVFSCYLIASTVAIPLYGRFADRHGPKRVLLVGIALFLAGSGLCAASRSMPQLLAARTVQGAGAGGLLTLAMIATSDLFAPQARARYQGLLGSAYGLATVVGPLAGGVLVQHLSWRWAFLVNLPLAAAAFAALLKLYHPQPRQRHGSIDYAGAFILGLALATALLLTRREAAEAPAMLAVQPLAVATVALLLLFVWHQSRTAYPLLPLALFARPSLCAASALSAVTGVALFTPIVFVPLYLQNARGLSPLAASVYMLPLMLAITATSVVGGHLIGRGIGMRPLAAAATVLAAVGYSGLASSFVHIPGWRLCALLALVGAGIGLLFPVITVVAQRCVDVSLIGSSTATSIMFRSVGGALGVSMLGSSFGQYITSGFKDAAARLAQDGASASATLETAYASSLQHVFYTVTLVCAAACLAVWALPRRPDPATPRPAVRAG